MKSMKRLFSSAVLVAAALLHTNAAAQGPPTLVVTEPVASMEFHDQVTLVGRSEAKIHSEIVSEVSGRVTAIDAAEGNWIGADKPLVSIDSNRIALRLRAKDAEAMQAKAQAELADDAHQRASELFGRDLISETTLDSARVSAIAARERYRQLDAERDQLALDLDNCTIRAPYSGYTLRRMVDVGEWVNQGTPVYQMVDLSQVIIAVDLPERYYGQLDIGSPASIVVSGDSANGYTGTVTGIARSASNETHTFPVLITVKNPNGKIAGGKLVRATLSLKEVFTSLAVHKDAIVRQGLQTAVYTVNDGKAMMIPVMTSSTDGKMIAVKSPQLTEGMPVVVRGNERIFPNAPVQISGQQTKNDSVATVPASATGRE